jgi:glycosyltransferase involved in cell wall biosynthesis
MGNWRTALDFSPLNSRYLHDSRFYLNLPKVSIVIPTLGREDRLNFLLKAIKETANYPEDKLEIIVERDTFDNRKGCPKTFNAGVERATGQLICYLSNDVRPQPDWLIHAVMERLRFGESCLVCLNDGVWNGKLATHFLVDKSVRFTLENKQFFFEGYSHVGCDNELTARMKDQGCFTYAPNAKVLHDHIHDEIDELAWNAEAVKKDRALLQDRLAWCLNKPDVVI